MTCPFYTYNAETGQDIVETEAEDIEKLPMKPTRMTLLHDLDYAEDLVLRRAFMIFDDHGMSSVPTSHLLLRCYIVEHSVLTEADVEAELARVASDEGMLDVKAFVSLMRSHCIGCNAAIARWARVSGGRPQIDAVECRAALHEMARECLGPVNAEDVDFVLDRCMKQCGVNVDYPIWASSVDTLARTIRALKQLPCV